jgi:phosphoribosylformylglycinamidine synthase
MAAAGHPGEDAALFDTVKAVGLEFCPALGISIPVGKDSLSMKHGLGRGRHEAGHRAAVADHLRLRRRGRRAPHADAAAAARMPIGDTELLLIDLGQGRNRLGGSALAQVYGVGGEHRAGCRRGAAQGLLRAIQELNAAGKLLAYHDRSDGGLFATVCEMASPHSASRSTSTRCATTR